MGLSSQIKDPVTSKFKLGRESFTRDGTLSPELVISLLVYMAADGGRRGYQHVLDAFWDDAGLNQVSLPVDQPVSAAAFCNARKRLCATAVRQLLRDTSDEFDRRHGQRHRIRGRRVLAVDGSKLPLQRASALWEEFGAPTDGHVPQASVSVLFDVVAKIPIDAIVGPCACDERAQLCDLLASTREGDILVLDRGYPSHLVIDMLIEHVLDFVVRVPVSGGFPAVEAFVRSGQAEAEIVLAPADSSAHLLTAKTLRAVRLNGPDGEPQVFLTTLSQFPRALIGNLYQLRWQIELFYRLQKSDYVGHHQFHAKYPDGIRQEVFAFLLFTAITRTLMAAASKAADVTFERISQKSAILATARALTVLLLESEPEHAQHLLEALLSRISARSDPKHRKRACPRRSFKPRSRWGPHGRILAKQQKEQLR